MPKTNYPPETPEERANLAKQNRGLKILNQKGEQLHGLTFDDIHPNATLVINGKHFKRERPNTPLTWESLEVKSNITLLEMAKWYKVDEDIRLYGDRSDIITAILSLQKKFRGEE